MVTRYPHTLSTQSLFRVLRAAQATPQEPSPGLYARIQPDNTRIQYQYYCPGHPDFSRDPLSGCYALFAHSFAYNTAVRFDMSGSVCPDYSADRFFDSTTSLHSIANNFSVLAEFGTCHDLAPAACEIYLKPPQPENPAYTNYLLELVDQLLSHGVLANYLEEPKDSAPLPPFDTPPIWPNYTWLAWLSPTPLEPSAAYSAHHIVGTFPSSTDPLHRPIPVTKESHALQDYTNLFTHTKVVGPTVYRGLDNFCSAYVRWVLSPPDPVSQACWQRLAWLDEDDIAPLAAKCATTATL